MGRQGRDIGAELRGKILRLHLAGCTVNQIMERTGLARATITKYLPEKPKKPEPHKYDHQGGGLE